MRISFADAGLPALDALDGIDSICLFVHDDERPLRGLAGFVDWRLCGGLSRVLLNGWFEGVAGDALLIPAQPRLPAARIFCYGAGRKAGFDAGRCREVLRKACDGMTLAGAKTFALELPSASGLSLEQVVSLFIEEGLPRLKADRLLVMGDARALAKAFAQSAGGVKGLQLDKEPLPAARSRGGSVLQAS